MLAVGCAMPSDDKIFRYILKPNLGFINLLLQEILHSLPLIQAHKNIQIYRSLFNSFRIGKIIKEEEKMTNARNRAYVKQRKW